MSNETPHPWEPGWTEPEPAASDEAQPAPGKDAAGRWIKGVSGNPKGRAKGCTNRNSPLEVRMKEVGEDILNKLAEMALAGDVQAANLVLQRIHPTLKSKAPTFVFDLDPDASLEAQARQVMAAISAGEVEADVGKMLVEVLHSFSALRIADELAQLERRPPALPSTVVRVPLSSSVSEEN